MNSNRSALWAIIGVIVGFGMPILFCVGTVFLLSIGLPLGGIGSISGPGSNGAVPQTVSGPAQGPAVGLIDISGPIVGGSSNDNPFSSTSSAAARDVIALIEQTAADPDVRAMLLRVNTPGGSVVASDQIYQALTKVEQPIVVLMGEVAASGGYYVSMAADSIYANQNTFTGSIGVIIQGTNVEELVDQVGIEIETFKSGDNKDLLSPYRQPSTEEQAILQGIVDEAFADFVRIVADGRGMTESEVREIADGRIYTGEQALALNLLDALGYEEDAIASAAELGGITDDDPRVIRYSRPANFADVFAQPLFSLPGVEALKMLPAENEVTLEYRWDPF
jgi:protease-4